VFKFSHTLSRQFHSRLLEHPFIPGRQLRVVCDAELVDMAFGTGAVKITPAHDPNDFKCGQRHNLQFINILDDDGKINRNGGKFAGMPRYDVRWALVQELTAMGLFRGTTPNPMRLGLDSRSKDVVEPIIRPQWFCRCKGMADKAVEAVRCGDLELLPAGMHEVHI
jgi:valyl-tRNA synthetase